MDNIIGEAVSLSRVLHSLMFVCLATKTLATSWGEEMPQGLLPTRAVQQGSEQCGIYRHRGTAPGNRGATCRPERVNILKDPCLLQYSLLHSLSLPVRGAFLPFQRWAGGSRAKAASIGLSVFLWPEVPSFIKDCILHLFYLWVWIFLKKLLPGGRMRICTIMPCKNWLYLQRQQQLWSFWYANQLLLVKLPSLEKRLLLKCKDSLQGCVALFFQGREIINCRDLSTMLCFSQHLEGAC